MKVIFIEEDKLTNKDIAHNYLKDILDFSDYYGNNLDALYDELTSLKNIEIIFIKTDIKSDYLNRIIKVFKDASDDNDYLKIINI